MMARVEVVEEGLDEEMEDIITEETTLATIVMTEEDMDEEAGDHLQMVTREEDQAVEEDREVVEVVEEADDTRVRVIIATTEDFVNHQFNCDE